MVLPHLEVSFRPEKFAVVVPTKTYPCGYVSSLPASMVADLPAVLYCRLCSKGKSLPVDLETDDTSHPIRLELQALMAGRCHVLLAT
jgi:hypothetical protein